MLTTSLVVALSVLSFAQARTDIAGCTSTISGNSYVYYVPSTGELCEFLDCGGGRAPPKTTVPGCPLYKGTATYSPNFLPGFAVQTGEPSVAIQASASTSALPTVPAASITHAPVLEPSTSAARPNIGTYSASSGAGGFSRGGNNSPSSVSSSSVASGTPAGSVPSNGTVTTNSIFSTITAAPAPLTSAPGSSSNATATTSRSTAGAPNVVAPAGALGMLVALLAYL